MKRTNKFLLSSVTLAVLTLMNQAVAADAEIAPAAATTNAPATAPAKDSVAAEVQQIVVTGTASGGVRKIDSSFSITTATEEQLKEAHPSSTADVLKIVPGVFAEATGGQSGANINVRGFPSGSDSPFVSIQLNGNPLFPQPTLSFLEGSSLFRLDDTIERVEVLRGGPSTIYSTGQPGATVNFLLKKGGNTPEGSISATFGTGNLRRFDGFYSGKIGDGWYGSIGGFYRITQGVRDPQFPADDGGQLTATLTRKLDQGELTLYARTTSDKNAFYTGVPVLSSNGGNTIKAFPGFDPLTGTLMSNEMRNFTIDAAPGKTLDRDLADGRGLNAHVFGFDFDKKVNGFTVSNKANFFGGNANTISMFTGANPLAIGDGTPDVQGSTPTYIGRAIAAANGNAAALAAAGGAPATSGTATYVHGGAVDPTQQVVQAGLWAVEKKLQSFSDEFHISKELIKDNVTTAGVYFTNYSSHDVWYLGNSHLMTAVPNASLINVSLNNGVVVSKNGVDGPVFYAPNATYNGSNVAEFISNEWKINDKMKVDVGFRNETQRLTGSVSALSSGDTDGNALTVYNNNTSMTNGAYTSLHRNDTAKSYTIGGNYKLSKDSSVFARANSGHTFIAFDDMRNAGNQVDLDNRDKFPTPKVTQYEVGFKTANDLYSAYVNLFHTDFKGISFQQITTSNVLVSTYGSTGNGLEFDVAVRPLTGLQIALTGDYQDSKYDKSNPDIAGKMVQRQPKLQFRLTPSYSIPLGDNSIKLYGTYSYIGKRWSDQQELVPLAAYHTIDAGLLASIGENLEFRLSGTNLTNTLGFTEGNSRIVGANAAGPVNMRPIFGRSIEASILYRF